MNGCWMPIMTDGCNFTIASATASTEYVELHACSSFSFLSSSAQPDDLVECAVEVGMPSIAICDRNGLYGAARFHTSANQNGIKAHIGAEIAVSSFCRSLPPTWLPNSLPNE